MVFSGVVLSEQREEALARHRVFQGVTYGAVKVKKPAHSDVTEASGGL